MPAAAAAVERDEEVVVEKDDAAVVERDGAALALRRDPGTFLGAAFHVVVRNSQSLDCHHCCCSWWHPKTGVAFGVAVAEAFVAVVAVVVVGAACWGTAYFRRCRYDCVVVVVVLARRGNTRTLSVDSNCLLAVAVLAAVATVFCCCLRRRTNRRRLPVAWLPW